VQLNKRGLLTKIINNLKSHKLTTKWPEKEKVEEENLQDKDQYLDHPKLDFNSQLEESLGS
jgi:uncharacterized protein YnzC (UPF0291/DUF896 family)